MRHRAWRNALWPLALAAADWQSPVITAELDALGYRFHISHITFATTLSTSV
jgi:hypothetical protein